MSPTLHVFTDHDRHKVLMELAGKVSKQVADNPHPNDYHVEDGQDGVPRTPSPNGK